MTSPWDRGDSHPVFGAAHPGCGGQQLAGGEAHVDVAPPALTAAVVEPRAHDLALAAAALHAHLGADPDVEAVPTSLAAFEQLRPTTTTVETHSPSSFLSTLLSRTPSPSVGFQH